MTADRFIMGGMPDNDYHDAMEKRLAAPTEQTEAQDDGAADTRNLRATVDSCANPPEIPDSSIDSPYAKWPRSRIHDVMDALRCITDWAYKNGHGEVGYEPEEVLRVWLINAWVDLESARSAMTVMVKERDACCDETRSAVRQVFADAEQVKALRADLAQKMQEHQDALSEMRGRMEGASHALRSYQYGNCSPDLAADMADSIDAALGNIRGDGARISGIEGIHGVNTKARHCQSCAELERRIRTLDAELVTARAVERHWLEFEEARQRELRAAPPSAGAV